MYYTVGEMAKKMGVAPSALRFYDKEGLLPFVERSGSGVRMFRESDFEWLALIGCLKKTGMPIKEIKAFIDWCVEGDPTIDRRLEIIKKQRESVKRQIAEMQEHLDMLDYKQWYYETAKEAGTCHIHKDMALEDIPEAYRKVYLRSYRMK